MLIWLVELADNLQFFNLFRYITFRTGAALFTSALVVFLFGPAIISSLRVRQGKGQPIRADGPQTHFAKAGTPTMGGLLILSALMVSTLLWARLDNPYVWIVMLVTLAFGLIGFADDYAKVTKQNTKGVSGKVRFGAGLMIAALATYAASSFHPGPLTNQLAFPFFKDLLLNMWWFFVPFGMVVIVGAANAVNLTDGLDGLAAGQSAAGVDLGAAVNPDEPMLREAVGAAIARGKVDCRLWVQRQSQPAAPQISARTRDGCASA